MKSETRHAPAQDEAICCQGRSWVSVAAGDEDIVEKRKPQKPALQGGLVRGGLVFLGGPVALRQLLLFL